jgi:hypothetical protein
MKRSSTFRVDHRQMRHKYRGVWGGAIVPGVIVIGFYASMLLDGWHGYDKDSATGRRLLDDEMRRQHKMQHVLTSSSDINVMNVTASAPCADQGCVCRAAESRRSAGTRDLRVLSRHGTHDRCDCVHALAKRQPVAGDAAARGISSSLIVCTKCLPKLTIDMKKSRRKKLNQTK